MLNDFQNYFTDRITSKSLATR